MSHKTTNSQMIKYEENQARWEKIEKYIHSLILGKYPTFFPYKYSAYQILRMLDEKGMSKIKTYLFDYHTKNAYVLYSTLVKYRENKGAFVPEEKLILKQDLETKEYREEQKTLKEIDDKIRELQQRRTDILLGKEV